MREKSNRRPGRPRTDAANPLPDRRDALLTVAEQLFADKGFAATNVSEIVEGAGVTQPVAYYYFKNKEAILEALVDRSLAAYRQVLATVTPAAEDPTHPRTMRPVGVCRPGLPQARQATRTIIDGCLAAFHLSGRNPAAQRLLFAHYYGPRNETAVKRSIDAIQSEFVGRIGAVVAAAVRQGVYRRVDTPVIAETLWAILIAAMTDDAYRRDSSRGASGLEKKLAFVLRACEATPTTTRACAKRSSRAQRP